MDASTLPPCTCDHDFWDGVNFHLRGICPKAKPVDDVRRMLEGWQVAAGVYWLRRRLIGG